MNGSPVDTVISIPAARSVQLNLSISVSPQAGTSQNVAVDFESNDPLARSKRIIIAIPSIKSVASLLPASLSFGTLVPMEPASQRVVVTADKSHNLRVERVVSLQPERFSTRLVPCTPDELLHVGEGKQALTALEVVPTPGQSGTLAGTVEIQVSGDQNCLLRLPVSGQRKSLIEGLPSALFLHRDKERSDQRFSLSLTVEGDCELTVVSSPGFVSIHLVKTAANRYSMTIGRKGEADLGNEERRKITLRLSRNGQLVETATLPVLLSPLEK